MLSRWEDFVDGLRDDAGVLAKSELKDLLACAKTDSVTFVRDQALELEKHLNELAAGAITKDEFEVLARDTKRLTEMEALKMSVAAKASAQRLVDGIGNLIINGLLRLI